jgi:hypothetical protein
MPLTTTASALQAILQPKLEAMAGPGGGSKDCAALAMAISTSITEWLASYGTDAVTVVQSVVAVTTTGGPTNQTGGGTVVTFTGKIV